MRIRFSALAATALVLCLAAAANAAQLLGGPSVRVTPGSQVEIKWQTDQAWYGKVEIFTSADGTGTPVATGLDVDGAGTKIATGTPTVSFLMAGLLAPDTTYYFRITSTDPTGRNADMIVPAPLPSFFTGVQALSDLQVTPSTTSAVVSWQGNVIGLGHVDYGTDTGYGQTADDSLNTTDHTITLTGLQPNTSYSLQACNRHAIDGDCLASSTGSFTTLSTLSDQFQEPLAQSSDPANPIINTGKNGKVIAVKVQISQGGVPVSNLTAPGPITIALSKLAVCSTLAGTDPVTSYADAGQSSAGTNQFHYDATSGVWIYDLDTKALGLVTGNCYRIEVAVNGTQITDPFAVYQPTK
jgi:hypothetical protein